MSVNGVAQDKAAMPVVVGVLGVGTSVPFAVVPDGGFAGFKIDGVVVVDEVEFVFAGGFGGVSAVVVVVVEIVVGLVAAGGITVFLIKLGFAVFNAFVNRKILVNCDV